MTFAAAFTHTVGVEGRYSNNPDDPGGETCWGITIAEARANGYDGAMRDMPLTVARMIYRAKYWDRLSLDAIDAMNAQLAAELFDTSVNCGAGQAASFLQIALNAFNRRGLDYADIAADGNIGPATLGALKSYLGKRGLGNGVSVMLRALNSQQGSHYLALAGKNSKFEDFEFGWFLNRVS